MLAFYSWHRRLMRQYSLAELGRAEVLRHAISSVFTGTSKLINRFTVVPKPLRGGGGRQPLEIVTGLSQSPQDP